MSARYSVMGVPLGPTVGQIERIGRYLSKLPPRTFNPDDLLAQVGKVERADPYVIELNREAIAEAHARLGAVLGEG